MTTTTITRKRPGSRRRGLRARPMGDKYLTLVRKFPLRPIRDDAEYDAAIVVLNRLVVRPEESLSAGERDYVDTLTLLIQAYDDVHHQIETSNLNGVEMLKYLMDQTGMRRIDLGRLLGNAALATFILNGQRELSKTHIRTLAKHFKVDASLFLDMN